MDRIEETRSQSAYCLEFLADLPHAALILDADGRIAFANEAAGALFTRSHGRPLIGLRHDDDHLFGPGSFVQIVDDASSAVPSATSPAAAVLESGRPVSAHLRVDRAHASRLYLFVEAVPLHSQLGGVVGVGMIYTDETEDVGRRSEGEWLRQELLESRRAVVESLRFSEALNAIGSAIHSTLDIDEVLGRVVEETARALGIDAGVVGLRQPGGWVIRAAWGLLPDFPRRTYADNEADVAVQATSTRRPVVVADAFEEGGLLAEMARRVNVRAILTVPLLARGEVIGVLSFLHPSPVRFTDEQVAFTVRVATTTALAMENARVYTEERHIADTLQRALLVVPEQLAGVDFEHLYQSATEAAWVGGDFFDLFELPGDRVVMVIGDISGKGVEASALASFTRQLLKAYVQVYDSPAEVVQHASEMLYRVSRTEDFVTLFLGVFSRADRSLVFCNAGHPAPIVRRRTGGSALLEDGGPLAGAWPGLPYEEHTAHLEAGDLLVLYTDGLIEAKRDGELFGDARLLELVDSLSERPLKELAPELVRRVTDFTHGRLLDDVALLLVSPR